MNDRPTPETQALRDTILAEQPSFSDALIKAFTHSKNLERQRDELLERLDAVLAFSITCCSGLDDDKFYPELDKLRNTHKTIRNQTNMTDQQTNIAVAEACGWTEISNIVPSPGIGMVTTTPSGVNTSGYRVRIPNYTTDLNAMHEAEETLTPQQKELFAKTLSHSSVSNVDGSTNYDEVFDAIHATARQRAIAFLKTLNLYNP